MARRDRDGYGRFYVNPKQIGAHRYSLEMSGRVLSGREVCMHKCDNRSCVNPSHLVVGLNIDNVRDRDNKGRGRYRNHIRWDKLLGDLKEEKRWTCRKTIEERFWEKVDQKGSDECWEWKTSTTADGYGQFGFKRNGKQINVKSSRVAYELVNGPIPKGEGYHGTCVCHKCDNRLCVNPSHLFLGTVGDNNRDRTSKGRQMRGVTHHQSKLTEEQVIQIRSDNRSMKIIGIEYGISATHVGKIKLLKAWKHLV